MTHYFTQLETTKVDPFSGTIKSASLITIGDARGHFDAKGRQIKVDEVTLEQIFKLCNKMGTVKVKADHGTGVMEIVGWADNFALTADKVLADVHIYESEPQRARLLEIAETNPHHMGISMEFRGDDKPRGTVTLARCNEIFAAALVDFAAANTSLFSAQTPEEPEPETETTTTTTMEDDTKQPDQPNAEDRLAKLETMFADFTAKFAKKFSDDGDDDDTTDTVATDPDTVPADSDPKKTYENPDADIDDEKTKIAEMAATAAVRKMSAALGAQGLGKPGTPATTALKAKHFEEHVADLAVSLFSGDQNAARAHILTNKQKFPDAWKAYADARQVRSI